MRLKTSTRLVLRRVKRFVIYRILHVDDTPHRIALGVAIGMFVAWTPFPGLQMILIFVLAALLRANKVVGLPLAWLNNPATAPVNLLCYWLGCWMLRVQGNGAKIVQAIKDALAPGYGFLARIAGFFHAVEDAFLPWLVGSLVIGLVTGAAAYVLTYRAVAGVRRRRGLGQSPSGAPQNPMASNNLPAQAVGDPSRSPQPGKGA